MVNTTGLVDLYLPGLRVLGSKYFFENDRFCALLVENRFQIDKVQIALLISQTLPCLNIIIGLSDDSLCSHFMSTKMETWKNQVKCLVSRGR